MEVGWIVIGPSYEGVDDFMSKCTAPARAAACPMETPVPSGTGSVDESGLTREGRVMRALVQARTAAMKPAAAMPDMHRLEEWVQATYGVPASSDTSADGSTDTSSSVGPAGGSAAGDAEKPVAEESADDTEAEAEMMPDYGINWAAALGLRADDIPTSAIQNHHRRLSRAHLAEDKSLQRRRQLRAQPGFRGAPAAATVAVEVAHNPLTVPSVHRRALPAMDLRQAIGLDPTMPALGYEAFDTEGMARAPRHLQASDWSLELDRANTLGMRVYWSASKKTIVLRIASFAPAGIVSCFVLPSCPSQTQIDDVRGHFRTRTYSVLSTFQHSMNDPWPEAQPSSPLPWFDGPAYFDCCFGILLVWRCSSKGSSIFTNDVFMIMSLILLNRHWLASVRVPIRSVG